MKKWIATVLGGIITAVVAALLISQFGGQKDLPQGNSVTQTKPEKPRSLLERLAGKYTMDSWRHSSSEQVILPPRSGTLTIADDGGIEMVIRMESPYGLLSEKGTPLYCIYTCHGIVSISDQRIKFGHCQGSFPNGLPIGMSGPQSTPEAMAALRSPEAAFGRGDPGYAMAIDEGSAATHLQMTNDQGILTWTRR